MNRWWVGVLLHLAGFAVVGSVIGLGSLIPTIGDSVAAAGWAFTMGCGIAQLLWVVPLIVFAVIRGYKKLIWGLAVSAALVLLLNTACYGVVITSLGNL